MFTEKITQLKEQFLYRQLKNAQKIENQYIYFHGQKYLNFASNNYLGLTFHPALRKAAQEAIEKYGVSSCSSRLLAGNLELYAQLESALSNFKKTEAALVFSSGYLANLGLVTALAQVSEIFFTDRYNHASLVDGILLSRVSFKRYPHGDFEALEVLLKKYPQKKKVIFTETIFSMDGDLINLPALVRLAQKYHCFLVIDDAHGTGVLGEKGRGASEHFGLESEIDLQMGTFSKALGGIGGFVAGKKEVISYLTNTARSLIYTTALPPAILAANLKSLEIVQKENTLREKLWENTSYLRRELKRIGFNLLSTQTPIIPVLLGETKLALEFSQALWESGIFMPAIRPPTVPAGQARLRLSVSALHQKKDLHYTLEQMEKIKKKIG